MLQWQFPRGIPQGRSHTGGAPRTGRPGPAGAAGAGPGGPCWGRGTPWQACRGRGRGRGNWQEEEQGGSRGKVKALSARALSDYRQYGPRKDNLGQRLLGRRQKPPAGAKIISAIPSSNIESV